MKYWLDKGIDQLLSLLGVDLDAPIDPCAQRFSRITDTLYLGARPDREHTAWLKDTGVTHIVSALAEQERAKVDFLDADFDTLFVAAEDRVQHDISAAFPTLFEFVQRATDVHHKAKLLVHCEAGVSRSATLAIALLMKTQGKTLYAAYCELRNSRPQVLPNIGFASQLQHLEFDLKTSGATEPESLSRYLCEICNVPLEPVVLQSTLSRHNCDALAALHTIFGPELPRVIQGLRL